MPLRATTFVAISLPAMPHRSRPRGSLAARVVPNPQQTPCRPHPQPILAAATVAFVCYPRGGGAAERNNQIGSACRPSNRAMHPATTASRPRALHSASMLWRGVSLQAADATANSLLPALGSAGGWAAAHSGRLADPGVGAVPAPRPKGALITAAYCRGVHACRSNCVRFDDCGLRASSVRESVADPCCDEVGRGRALWVVQVCTILQRGLGTCAYRSARVVGHEVDAQTSATTALASCSSRPSRARPL